MCRALPDESLLRIRRVPCVSHRGRDHNEMSRCLPSLICMGVHATVVTLHMTTEAHHLQLFILYKQICLTDIYTQKSKVEVHPKPQGHWFP